MKSAYTVPRIAGSLASLDPSRKPDWRWWRAERLRRLRQRPRKDEDPLVLQAFAFLGRRNQSQRPPRSSIDQAIHATLLFVQSEDDLQDEIQARLLAGEPHETIAIKIGISLEVVGMYAELFYDVGGSREAHVWIQTEVLRTWTCDLSEGDLWRWMGWLGGPVLVDLLVADHRKARWPDWPDHAGQAGKMRAIARFECTPLADPRFLDRVRDLEAAIMAVPTSLSASELACAALQLRFLETVARGLQKPCQKAKNAASRKSQQRTNTESAPSEGASDGRASAQSVVQDGVQA